MPASGIGIQAVDAVDQPMFHQKIKGAIDGGGLGAGIRQTQLIQQIIGFHRPMALPNQRQHLPSLGGQPDAAGMAQAFRRGHGGFLAMMVVCANAHGWGVRFLVASCNVIL